jgi:hypothetical protein
MQNSTQNTTSEIFQLTANDPISFALSVDYHTQPRYLILAMRLMSFGYSDWLSSGECTLPETVKKIIRHYQEILADNPGSFNTDRKNTYNRAGLKMLNHYPDYQHWLYHLDGFEELYNSPYYEKYRLISSPLTRCPYITKDSAERMRYAGIYSLHQMLLTLTYPQMRERGYISKKEAQKLFPRLKRLGVFPVVEVRELIVSADQLFDAVYELTATA